ncbi:MAG: VWA domain-containing protein [Firmicutes bacterium]|nr:VWA domain-containing protein [Bacillota bacterium]
MKKILCGILLFITALSLIGCGANYTEGPAIKKLSIKDADETLISWMTKLQISYGKPQIDLDTSEQYIEELPDINSSFQLTVIGNNQANIEIWASTERSGTGNDGWINRVTENFNKANIRNAANQTVSVSIRSIDAGAQLDYLTLSTLRPDAWSPANSLWNDMAVSRGVPSVLALERTVGNTAGILMKKSVYNDYIAKHGTLELDTLIQAAIDGEIVLGFTNPYTSDTALNMLTQMLIAMDKANPLSAEAANRFLEFQKNAPPPAYTTAQMRESAKKGFIDVMTMECQAYTNEPTLSDYVFTPFGVRHDNPVYKFKDTSAAVNEILDLWIAYITNAESQQLGTKMGFNKHDDYLGTSSLSGPELYAAQSLWKANKSGGRTTVAVFVADVSGSMAGSRINNLKDSLLNSMQYISEDSEIGLVSYSNNITIELPIDKFQGSHRAMFQSAVKGLYVGGNTHMYSAVLTALDMIRQHRESGVNANYMIFVLTDGENNGGVKEDIAAQLIVSYGIPVHTIGMGEANPEALKRLSNYTEGFSINVSTENIIYNMKNMFNSQM